MLYRHYIAAEDAVLGVEAGVDGILVSNHGARQLDGVPATVRPCFQELSVFDNTKSVKLLNSEFIFFNWHWLVILNKGEEKRC